MFFLFLVEFTEGDMQILKQPIVRTINAETIDDMKKEELKNKESITQHAISLEDDPNKLATLQNDLKIIRLRLQIDDYKERVEVLKNKKL